MRSGSWVSFQFADMSLAHMVIAGILFRGGQLSASHELNADVELRLSMGKAGTPPQFLNCCFRTVNECDFPTNFFQLTFMTLPGWDYDLKSSDSKENHNQACSLQSSHRGRSNLVVEDRSPAGFPRWLRTKPSSLVLVEMPLCPGSERYSVGQYLRTK